jgi:hypothetical protein
VSVVPLQRHEPNAQRFVGSRAPFAASACRAAPPPIRTVTDPAN